MRIRIIFYFLLVFCGFANAFANQLYIDTKTLPMDLSFERVRGDGSRNVYIFCDVDCPHCMRTEKLLKDVDNIRINMFVFPVESYHPDAPRKTNAIWCSKDRAKAWQDWFDKKELPDDAVDCEAPLKAIESYAHDNGIELPVIIFEDGTGYHADDFITATANLKMLKALIDIYSNNVDR